MTKATERLENAARTAATAAREASVTVLHNIVEPAFVENLRERATPAGQWIAACTLVVLVPLTFTFTVIWHRLLVSLVLRGIFQNASAGAFLVTLLTLLFFTVGCWFWFQWTRTAGLGMFNMRFGGDP